ncbi:hexokinase [Anaerobacterium chartisolvens]|uniref:Hexokinase n=1 Tax=Anaerobacterium chartisolvens TaxID=1297424 RepID=A0A369ANK4_9FIRM|nr:hexokinase [Anaerobacterium chartisolvens]RCX09908.1 hexokinase [Anaerobacterium chartisolvens]
MNEIIKKVNTFLMKYRMHHEGIDLARDSRTFIEDMDRGLAGEESTLKMLCTYLNPEGDIPVNEPVIVIDAGGTNFRVAVVTFDSDKKPAIDDFKLYSMPGTNGEISKDEFFNTIAGYLESVINKSNKIGFCFSYPTEILPNKDGKLIRFNKEVRVRGMHGVEIGSSLLEALKQKGYTNKKSIVLLNDTVATLLGGKAAHPDRKFDSYIGFILGTGTNTCYIEENSKIKKARDLADAAGSTMINIESGGYGKATRGELDEQLDLTTSDPGSQQFEKMISGAYQGKLLMTVMKKAAQDGLFTDKAAENLLGIKELVSRDIDDFCYYPYSKDNVLGRCINSESINNENNRLTLYYIIDAIIERAAKLTAINLAAVIVKTGRGKNPLLPVCVAAEGTTFYKSKLFRGKLDHYIREYFNEESGIFCEFAKTENATLTGTAIAGLLN